LEKKPGSAPFPSYVITSAISVFLNGGFKMGINYKELINEAKNKKFKHIFDKIRYIRGKTLREQLWWIRFYRLQNTWQKHYTTKFPGDRFVDKIIYNSNRHDDYRDPNPWDAGSYKHGWLGQNHMVNQVLKDVEELFDSECIEWENIPVFDIKFPKVFGVVV